MTESNETVEELKRRLVDLLQQFDDIDPEKLTVEDIDYYLRLLDEMEQKLK
ncbi:SE1561 family protein [Halalkalibacillus sediminis]|uniref:SE1561 family protein n=1 Tax=Halalkalibacillus sediminis TaxID=2018042 RepID=UPI00192E4D9B|nr:SE1561 family protein [Halalkalibacillus sediminis]